MMPPLFRALVVVYVALCVVWAAEVAVARRRARSIHYAILAALVGKCVEVAMQLAYFSALRERGTVSAALRASARTSRSRSRWRSSSRCCCSRAWAGRSRATRSRGARCACS